VAPHGCKWGGARHGVEWQQAGRGPGLVGVAGGALVHCRGACLFKTGEKEGPTGGPPTTLWAAVNQYSNRFEPIQMV
jgi:hypothetical protein